jgi:hypothetical protein
MKLARVLVSLGLTLCSVVTWAQNYSLTGGTITGGGGTSTGGVYSVSGSIGQPDAGSMSGGSYSLEGGLWSIISIVPTPGAPKLSLTRAANQLLISWPAAGGAGYQLEQTPALASPSWVTNSGPVMDSGTNKTVTIQLTPGNLFLRLRKP